MLTPTKIAKSLAHLFYPHVCTGCGTDVVADDNLLCAKCIYDLPKTNYAAHANNPIERNFYGRLQLVAAHAEYYFAKEALVQHLMHQLKYKADIAIGIYLGEKTGATLLNSNRFKNIDALIPLPLFADKEKKRGYNQAAIICNGMSKIMNVPVFDKLLFRQRFTETQTRKHRTERWENVDGSFVVKNEKQVEGKHLLLVDDVITTGATLEAAGRELLKISGVSVSIATLAYATK